MSWWPSSWFPPLPSIDFTLPSGIQKRFISFVLRQTLGRFLKPGQLDTQQVDSQIGSGYVQVRDVELDNEAINSLISDLPVYLHDGSVGKVTARIPWPNPLTSSVGLSVESLHLTFYLSPQKARNIPPMSPSILAESVASVADTFIHEELSPPEEAELRESLHIDPEKPAPSTQDYLPGGFDPFLSDGDDARGDVDPAGVSIFATLLERLLARFEFDASDLTITLVHPDHASFTLTIPEVRYSAESKGASTVDVQGQDHEPSSPNIEGVIRSVTISGITVTTRCLRPPSPVPITPSTVSPVSTRHPPTSHNSPPGSPSPPSPYSDNSDLDDDTQLLMSQSIAVFPPRPPSPTSSVASSMYQSAISTTSTTRHHADDSSRLAFSSIDTVPSQDKKASPLPPILEVMTNEIEDETLVSFASDPIILRLITPPPARPARTEPPSKDESSKATSEPIVPRDDAIRAEVTLGTIGVALRARHFRSLLDVVQLWVSHSPSVVPASKPKPATNSQPSSLLDNLQANLQLRGIVVLLLPGKEVSQPRDTDALADFFRRPVTPPRCSHGFVRLQLENIGASLSLKSGQATISRITKTAPSKQVLQSSFWISDLSIFAFISSGATDLPSDLSASPILITDPRLPSQYPVSHTHTNIQDPEIYSDLPCFDVEDWTHPSNRATSAKLSLWRTKLPHGRPSSVVGSPARKSDDLPIISPSHPSPLLSSPLKRPVSLGTSISPGKVTEVIQRSQTPAVQVNVTMETSASVVKTSRGLRNRSVTSTKVEVDLVPLHVFIDLGLVEGKNTQGNFSHTLSFIETISTPTLSSTIGTEGDDGANREDEEPDEEDADTPPATPRVGEMYGIPRAERERENERRRLERMVLEDLNLGFDYGHNTSYKAANQLAHKKVKRKSTPAANIVVNLPMIRVQIRVPPPLPRLPRSGAVILDIHNIRLSPGEFPRGPENHSIRFTEPLEGPLREPQLTRESAGNVLLTADWQRMVVSHCGLDDSKAKAILSIGAMSIQDSVEEGGIDIRKPFTRPEHSPKPQVTISESEPSAGPVVKTLAVDIEIPSVHVHLSKPQIDGLQLWADDLTQVIERAFSTPVTPQDSKNTSLIGSRFFAKRDRGSGAETTSTISGSRTDARSQTVIKVAVSEAALRLSIPRDSGTTARPFDIVATDIDVLLEVKPEGKDETVLTLGIMDVVVKDISKSSTVLTLLALTVPRNLSPTVRPLLKLRFTSLVVPGTTAKESRIKVTLCGITFDVHPDFDWVADVASFVKAPPGAFESVVPSERTRVEVKLVDTSIRALAPTYPGAIAVYLEEIDFKTVIEGNLPETSFSLSVRMISLFLIDDLNPSGEDASTPAQSPAPSRMDRTRGVMLWKALGYALMAELLNVDLTFLRNDQNSPADSRINVDQATIRVHLCADTATALTAFIADLSSALSGPPDNSSVPREKKGPTTLTVSSSSKRNLMASLDENAFRRIPEVGAAPDMIMDDLPSNLDYLDQSFSATAGLREITDDDFDDFGTEDNFPVATDQPGVVSKHGGETIRMLQPILNIVEHHFDALPPDANDEGVQFGDTTLRVRAKNCDATLFLYDGYDWARTRRIIEEEARNMRRKLAKIRQLVAEGQTPDPSVEETNTLLFNSVYLGLEHNIDELEPGALISAIDEELNEDMETASQSSWQSLQPQPMSPGGKSGSKRTRRSKASKRSKGPSIEFKLMNLGAEVDQYKDHLTVASRMLITVHNIEILDHIKTSTWRKFLTALWLDSKGNIRETDSNMARIELRKVYPAPGNPITEARLRAKLLPLKLHVDQDALDFLKKFFAFKDPDAAPPPSTDPADDIFFQQAEVFPVDIKLDYKPRRVDYRALRDGKTIELMNFFHFDGAEMTLRHITLTGITGWPRFFDLLNDLWTPDVKATQLVDVISGVAPIRSVVNVGSGVADLVLLPIAQYRKDGRVVRGLQKGTTAFVKSTAIEAIKLGARLATGTQVILEQAEDVLGGQFRDPVTAEALQYGIGVEGLEEVGDEDDLISRYADQPMNVKEGVKSAYKSLKRNLNSAAQTILAVPMEVYEKSGNEGTVRAVVRAVPIAVLKPMIGASEAVSKTLLGLHNSLDPTVRLENEAKYKQR